MMKAAALAVAALPLFGSAARAQNAPEYTQMDHLIQRNTNGIGDALRFNQNIKPSLQSLTDTAAQYRGKPAIPSVPSVGASAARDMLLDTAKSAYDAVNRPAPAQNAIGEVQRQYLEDATRISQAAVGATDPAKQLGDLIAKRNCQFNPAACPSPIANAEKSKSSASVDISPFQRLKPDPSLPSCGRPSPMTCNLIGTPYSLVLANPQRNFTNECGNAGGTAISQNIRGADTIALVDCTVEAGKVVAHVRSIVPLSRRSRTIVPLTIDGRNTMYIGKGFSNYCLPCKPD